MYSPLYFFVGLHVLLILDVIVNLILCAIGTHFVSVEIPYPVFFWVLSAAERTIFNPLAIGAGTKDH